MTVALTFRCRPTTAGTAGSADSGSPATEPDMRRRRTPEGEYAASLRIARAMSPESRERFVDLSLRSAAGYDELAGLERRARADLDGDLYADVYVSAGKKRTVARRANADARRATIHRAEALGYGMQYGPVEPEGVRNG